MIETTSSLRAEKSAVTDKYQKVAHIDLPSFLRHVKGIKPRNAGALHPDRLRPGDRDG